jgi:hypothetical protein
MGSINKIKISITVRECQNAVYCLLRLFGSQRVYEVISQKNILLPGLISESQLRGIIEKGNVEVIVKERRIEK